MGEGEIERLRAALQTIADGNEPRPIGRSWRTDGAASKHDRCIHGAWMYEDCGVCVADFAREALEPRS